MNEKVRVRVRLYRGRNVPFVASAWAEGESEKGFGGTGRSDTLADEIVEITLREGAR